MVNIKKELTHIYHDFSYIGAIVIGASQSVLHKQIELFDKSLALTSDLKRLPFLLGGKAYIVPNAHALYGLFESAITGLSLDVVLLNGSYNAEDYEILNDLLTNEKALDDMLLHANGLLSWHTRGTDGVSVSVDLVPSHWDFEGQIVLYDTITLMVFANVDTNVSSVNLVTQEIIAMVELEIDWRPFSEKQLQEFIMEHIYAKQGD